MNEHTRNYTLIIPNPHVSFDCPAEVLYDVMAKIAAVGGNVWVDGGSSSSSKGVRKYERYLRLGTDIRLSSSRPCTPRRSRGSSTSATSFRIASSLSAGSFGNSRWSSPMPVLPQGAAPSRQPLVLAWGLAAPPEAIIAWGARAIYKLQDVAVKVRTGCHLSHRIVNKAEIDIPHDRQAGAFAPDTTEQSRAALYRWLNTKGLLRLRRECVKQYLTGDSTDEVIINDGLYHLKASPRASHGYLYIVAWVAS